MASRWKKLNGIIERGHRVASGLTSNSPYPHGSIQMQIPFFKNLGLDLTDFYAGTLNVSITPYSFEMVNPQFTLRHVAWTDKHPPETFSFSPCRITANGSRHDAWIYYPHPETKITHFQTPSTVEVISTWITGLDYGSAIEFEYMPSEVSVKIMAR